MKRTPALLAAAAAAVVLAACSTNSSGGNSDATLTTATTSPTATSPQTATGRPSPTPPSPSSAGSDTAPAGAETPITITVGDAVITATLNDTQVAQDFIQTLPTTPPWFRNSGIEYITELPGPLTETGPFYTDVQPGDLVYYNPLDSITIIYDETSSVPTLTKMGEIASDLSVFRDLPDDVDMRIELG